ncbi:unnamed protein product [Pleuronectes platessa]|uniref:Uncharacterized protein n=1 Tax=Pleuronectes platessa TaxID=8262 RepID=A0A9N7UWY3_PLEPL|nr:unnamed protein product [Pleuronectes platessa]
MSNKAPVKEKKKTSIRKAKATRSVFYCMNEEELVEAAVSYLTDTACQGAALPPDHKVPLLSPTLKVGDKAVDANVTIRGKPASSKTKAKSVLESLEEESSDCTDAQEDTYISETDLDITDVETLPYTENQGFQGQRSGPVQDPGGVMKADKQVARSQTPADAAQQEDDGLQLVREIFFT